jgi:hypothetical protein
MLRILVIAISVLFNFQSMAAAPAPASPQPSVAIKGFHEWKNEKIQSTTAQIGNLKLQIARSKAENNKKTAENLEKQIDQLKWNLDVVHDLSVADYFVLYLSQLTQPDRFTQAAAKLSTKEVAELMEAYADTLSNSSPAEVVVRPGATPSKLPVQAIQLKDQFK